MDIRMPSAEERAAWLKAGEDLLRTDTAFLQHLRDIDISVLRHLVHSDVADKSQMQMRELLRLNGSFHTLWEYTDDQCKRLQKLLHQGDLQSSQHVFPLSHMKSIQELYIQYFSSFTNFVVIRGFDYISKKMSNYWKENISSLKKLVSKTQKSESSVSICLFRIMHECFREQINQYTFTLALLSKDAPEIAGNEQLNETLEGMMDLKIYISQVLDEAALTRDLWKSLGQKLTDILCRPERRLREDSKNIPIALSTERFGHNRILLCDDILIHLQGSDIRCYDLTTVWTEVITKENSDMQYENIILLLKICRNLLKVITPEEQLTFHTPEPHHQVVWHWKVKQAVRQCLLRSRDFPLWGKGSKGQSPADAPACRFSTYTFKNEGKFKNAIYEGDWNQGKPHGKGTMKWEDGRNYTGDFENGLEHGFGVFLVPLLDAGYDCYKCHWNQGKKQRYGICEYSTKTVYRGYFKDDVRHGFGILESCRGESNSFRYVGNWMNDKRHGYGVLESMERGELYIGMWQDDQREGCGIVVTQSGLCYEGVFQQNKLTGKGILLSEDNSLYEGEFTEDLQVKGKGKMTFSDGTTIEGTFSNTFGNGLQVQGFMTTTSNSDLSDEAAHLQLGVRGLPVLERWPGIFDPYVEYLHSGAPDAIEEAYLGFHVENGRSLRSKILERPASLGNISYVTCSRKPEESHVKKSDFLKDLKQQQNLEQLQQYLEKSLQSSTHLLGKLLQTLVLVFQVSYSGIGANKHLLTMAQDEMKNYAEKIAQIIRDCVPQLFPQNSKDEESRMEMSMCSAVLNLMLPAFYPELSMLYMLYHDKDNGLYWQGILHLGLLSETKLLEFLDVQKHLWPLKDLQLTSKQRYSLVHDQCFISAIECVQKISTTVDPRRKLDTLFRTVDEIERTVSAVLMRDYKLPVDDLLPLLIYVVSRARIQHLGAELHYVRDMVGAGLEGGITDFLLTALESCYLHIQKQELRRGRFLDFI
ncbi:ALS2 C-terminal-like protein [Arapaima gigas]